MIPKFLFTYRKYRSHRTVVMNDVQSRSSEQNLEIVQFHISPLSACSWSVASKKDNKSVYFIKHMQRLYDEFHDKEYDSEFLSCLKPIETHNQI